MMAMLLPAQVISANNQGIKLDVRLPAGLTNQVTTPAESSRLKQVSVRSPEVDSDGRATLRLWAPQAGSVSAVGNMGQFPMTRDERGVWSVTFGPLQPDLYEYRFEVDGVKFLDPDNPAIKGPRESILQISPPTPALWEMRDVPHGQVHIQWYDSNTLAMTRRLHVYTPPGYDPSSRRLYPVLYLLHGGGDDDSWGITTCRANLILDNLVAEKRVQPMIVVMPYGFNGKTADLSSATSPVAKSERFALFASDLLHEMAPLIESSYRVKAGPEHRAIAGISMGGGQALYFALVHPDQFRWVALGSPGFLGKVELETDFPDVRTQAAKGVYQFKLFWIGCGTSDKLLDYDRELDQWLSRCRVPHEYHEFPGHHDSTSWRNDLIQIAPRLFAPSP
jgi:enterochelin esterase family protein